MNKLTSIFIVATMMFAGVAQAQKLSLENNDTPSNFVEETWELPSGSTAGSFECEPPDCAANANAGCFGLGTYWVDADTLEPLSLPIEIGTLVRIAVDVWLMDPWFIGGSEIVCSPLEGGQIVVDYPIIPGSEHVTQKIAGFPDNNPPLPDVPVYCAGESFTFVAEQPMFATFNTIGDYTVNYGPTVDHPELASPIQHTPYGLCFDDMIGGSVGLPMVVMAGANSQNPGDHNGDGVVGIDDLTYVISEWDLFGSVAIDALMLTVLNWDM
jgi:hypothetical protein